MLYHFYEMQHVMLNPARRMASATQHVVNNPLNPMSYTYGGRMIAAACNVFEHSTRRFGKPEFGLNTTQVKGETVRVFEELHKVKTFGRLLHFRRDTDVRDPRVLIVAPMSGHFATLLRGTVEALLPSHDVWITDWADARDVPLSSGSFDLDDYIDYVIDWVRYLGSNTHLVAVCQPSVPMLAAVSIMSADQDPSTPASMTMMGGPVDTRESPTKVNLFAKEKPLSWFERNVITLVPAPNPGMMRRVYPGFLQLAGFMSMNLDRHVNAHYEMFQHLVEGDDESLGKKRQFYEEYRSVMDLDAKYYLQTLQTVFHDHALPRQVMISRNRPVKPAKITRTALMTVEGELDDISGVGQTKAAHKLCSSLDDNMRTHYEQPKVGHYGIFNGGKWRRFIAPKIAEFIRTHDHAKLGRDRPVVTEI